MSAFGFSFESFNKEHDFDFDTSVLAEIPAEDRYKNLERLYNEAEDDEEVYIIRGAYINTKSDYVAESPLVATDNCYVNIPQFQLPEVKAILADPRAIKAINQGKAGFKIVPYEKNGETYYKAKWVTVRK